MSIRRIAQLIIIASCILVALVLLPGAVREVLANIELTASITGFPFGSAFKVSQQTEVDAVTPSIAYNPDRQEYLVVWYNDRPGFDDIQAQRVSLNGKLLGQSFYIAAKGAERRFPDVVYNSNAKEYLVVWEQDQAMIKGCRLSGAGAVIGNELSITNWSSLVSRSVPAVSYSTRSKRYMVVWESHTQGSVSSDIKGQALHDNGVKTGAQVDIAIGDWNTSHSNPDIAFNRRANGHMVVWERQNKSVSPPISDIYAILVHGDGLPTTGHVPIVAKGVNGFSPAVAANPFGDTNGQYMVLWREDQPLGKVIVYTLRNGDGVTPASHSLLSYAWDEAYAPSVAADVPGNKYLTAWTSDYGNTGMKWVIDTCEVSTNYDSNCTDKRFILDSSKAGTSAVASGSGNFLVVYDDNLGAPLIGIYGQLWGSQVFLPLVVGQ